MLSNIRYAWRTLAKSPGFLFTATAALALGIGANAAIFSIVNATLLNPAGIANPERIVAVRVRYDKLNLRSIRVSPPDFADVRDNTQVFEHAAVMEEGDFNYTGNTTPERLQGAGVSVQWFDVFGAKPRLGRVFRNEEDQPKANHEVVFSYQAWQRLFGADPKVLGRKIELNKQPYEIVGVMGPEFRWPAQADLWVPMGLPASVFGEGDRFNEELFAVARLRPSLSVNDANALIRILVDRVRNNGTRGGAYAQDSAWGMFAVPITDFIAGDTKKPMLVLLGAVGFVLLIACANIAGLMLARASGRAREIAVRAALGASRWNLIRQALLESVLLVLPGSIAALGVAYLGIRLLLLLAPEQLATGLTVQVDAHVLLFTATIAIAAAILSGIAPAWQISRIERYESLKEGGRSGTASRGRQRLRSALVTAEVALALVLLAGAGLFLRSLIRLQDIGTGFQPRGVMTATLSLPRTQYDQPEKRVAFFRAVIERLQGGAGVVSAGLGTPLPFSGGESSGSFRIEGREVGPGDPGPHGDVRYVTGGYFQALGIPVLRGRALEDQDRAGSLPVVAIDENLAKQYWPNENPVGKHLGRGQRGPWSTIVGVVGHVKHSDLAGDTGKGVYYYSLFQQAIPFVSIVVKTAGDPSGMAGIIRDAVRSADPSQPVHTLKTLPDMVASSLAPRRFAVSLLGFFAATALLMAAIGLYGVIGYSVGQRTQEMGIRMALGAARSEVLGLVIAQGLRMTAAGLVIGIAAALALTRLVSSQLFGITPFDPLTFAVAALVLLTAALAASYFPARRATRVDPMSALRYE